MKIIDDDPREPVPYVAIRVGDSYTRVVEACYAAGAVMDDKFHVATSGTPEFLTTSQLALIFPLPPEETLAEFNKRMQRIRHGG